MACGLCRACLCHEAAASHEGVFATLPQIKRGKRSSARRGSTMGVVPGDCGPSVTARGRQRAPTSRPFRPAGHRRPPDATGAAHRTSQASPAASMSRARIDQQPVHDLDDPIAARGQRLVVRERLPCILDEPRLVCSGAAGCGTGLAGCCVGRQSRGDASDAAGVPTRRLGSMARTMGVHAAQRTGFLMSADRVRRCRP
jgi:hypothetical protein